MRRAGAIGVPPRPDVARPVRRIHPTPPAGRTTILTGSRIGCQLARGLPARSVLKGLCECRRLRRAVCSSFSMPHPEREMLMLCPLPPRLPVQRPPPPAEPDLDLIYTSRGLCKYSDQLRVEILAALVQLEAALDGARRLLRGIPDLRG